MLGLYIYINIYIHAQRYKDAITHNNLSSDQYLQMIEEHITNS